MSPDIIKPIFHMYTLEARSLPRNYSYNATQSQLRYSTFNPKLKTALIIHGFQSGLSRWMEVCTQIRENTFSSIITRATRSNYGDSKSEEILTLRIICK